MTLEASVLATYVARQLSTTFPDRDVGAAELEPYHRPALERLEHCFRHVRRKYFFDGEHACFDHLNTDQYAMYLYYLSNSVHRFDGDPALGAKIYALNKALHALDVYYQVELPEIFAWQHPVGTVLGRGTYANYLFVYQRCTVGANLALDYPTFDEGVVLYGDTALIGKTHVRKNTWLSVGAKVLDQEVGGDAVIFGRSPNVVTKRAKRSVIETLFSPV